MSIASITSGVTSAITMGGSVIDAIAGTDGAWGAVSDIIGLQIGLTVIGWSIGKLKSLTMGF